MVGSRHVLNLNRQLNHMYTHTYREREKDRDTKALLQMFESTVFRIHPNPSMSALCKTRSDNPDKNVKIRPPDKQ